MGFCIFLLLLAKERTVQLKKYANGIHQIKEKEGKTNNETKNEINNQLKNKKKLLYHKHKPTRQ
jgi:hypothetical protein